MEMGKPGQHATEDQPIVSSAGWLLFGLFVGIDIVWVAVSDVRFPASNFLLILRSIAIFAAIYCMPYGIARYLSGDDSAFARSVSACCRTMTRFWRALFFMIGLSVAGCSLTYLAASLNWPLQDALLARADSFLGFDWLALLAATNEWQLGLPLRAAYHSATPQILALFVFFAVTKRNQRLSEFFTLFAVCLLATAVISAFVPAAGAYAHFKPPAATFSTFSNDAGMWHYEIFGGLRNNPAPVLHLDKIEGLVTFPSFHTALAIITAYAVRGIRFVAMPVALLNAAVIVSTLPEGGHYLVDVIAGAMIAIVSIIGYRISARATARTGSNVLGRSFSPTSIAK